MPLQSFGRGIPERLTKVQKGHYNFREVMFHHLSVVEVKNITFFDVGKVLCEEAINV